MPIIDNINSQYNPYKNQGNYTYYNPSQISEKTRNQFGGNTVRPVDESIFATQENKQSPYVQNQDLYQRLNRINGELTPKNSSGFNAWA